MNGELPEGLVEKARLKLETEAAAETASRVPLPGPTLAAMLPRDIEAEAMGQKFSFRPMYDLDFTILQDLKHPLCAMAIEGKNWAEKPENLRGQDAWTAIWILTHPIKEVKKAWQSKSIESLASEQFGEQMRIGEITQLLLPVFEQFKEYFSTMVGFESATGDGQEMEKKSA